MKDELENGWIWWERNNSVIHALPPIYKTVCMTVSQILLRSEQKLSDLFPHLKIQTQKGL